MSRGPWRRRFLCDVHFARASRRFVVVNNGVMIDSEASLVQKAQRGDRAAFDELVRRCSRLVFARLHLDCGDLHQAEDLLQETLLTAFRSLGQLAEPDKFRPWLLKIAANTAINAVRHDQRQKRVGSPGVLRLRLSPTEVGTTNASPDKHLEDEERRQQLLGVLRMLPEE